MIESLNNGPEKYVLTDQGDISNYLGFNIKKKFRWDIKIITIAPSGKNINHVGIEVSENIKAREKPAGKPLLHKDKSSLGRKIRMELQGSDWYAKLSLGINSTRNINILTHNE